MGIHVPRLCTLIPVQDHNGACSYSFPCTPSLERIKFSHGPVPSARVLSAQIILLRKQRHPSRLFSLDRSGLGNTSGLDGLRSLGGGGRTRGGGRTWAGRGCLGLGLLGAKDTLQARGLVGGAAVLLLLKLSQTTCLGVDVLELLLTLVVYTVEELLEDIYHREEHRDKGVKGHTEVDQLLSRRSVGRLLKVRVQPRKQRAGLGGDAIALINRLGAIDGVELAVELVELGEEACRDAVLLVKVERARDGGVADNVAVREVLSKDA